jgi:hypothetical protein
MAEELQKLFREACSAERVRASFVELTLQK